MRYTRPDSFPPIVKNLIIINALVYLAQVTLGVTHWLELYPAMPEQLHRLLVRDGAYNETQGFEPYQIATHMFSHSPYNPMHILFNMFGLYMFGKTLENIWGPQRFLFFYLVCGVGAALAHLAVQYFRCQQLLDAVYANDQGAVNALVGATAPALGASGAIMGIFAAFAYLFPNTHLYIMLFPVPIKAKWAVLGMAALDLFGGVANYSGDNIAHIAHLGGALTGFILVLIWNKTNKKRFY